MPGKSKKGGGLESSPVYKKQKFGEAKSPFMMKSPLKQKTIHGKLTKKIEHKRPKAHGKLTKMIHYKGMDLTQEQYDALLAEEKK